jgi:hypothetical protein
MRADFMQVVAALGRFTKGTFLHNHLHLKDI